MNAQHPVGRRPAAFLMVATLIVTVSGCNGDETTAPTTGSLRVTTTTTGSDLDPDGYTLAVDQQNRTIPSNGSETFANLAAGTHTVQLTGVAANCAVADANPRTVSVTAGQTAQTTFSITCTALTGSIQVITSTTGVNLDPDGYTVAVDGQSVSIGLSANQSFSALAPGDYSVELTGVAPNCAVDGSNPRSVTVTAGSTAPSLFDITCMLEIAFSTDRDNFDFEIYVMREDGTNPRRLTSSASIDAAAAWSPDGSKLAFHSDRDGNFEIYVINADGSGLVRLTNDANDDFTPHWSPDGAKIAFSRTFPDGNEEVFAMDADGSNPVNLTNDMADDRGPAWSPDGAKIAFHSNRDGDFEIFVMDADGQNPVKLTDNAAWDSHPDWSPDGLEIAFSTDRDGNFEVYVMGADGSSPLRLTNNAEFDLVPKWSPDGASIAWSTSRDTNLEVYMMASNGTNKTNLTNSAVSDDSGSDWSPIR